MRLKKCIIKISIIIILPNIIVYKKIYSLDYYSKKAPWKIESRNEYFLVAVEGKSPRQHFQKSFITNYAW